MEFTVVETDKKGGKYRIINCFPSEEPQDSIIKTIKTKFKKFSIIFFFQHRRQMIFFNFTFLFFALLAFGLFFFSTVENRRSKEKANFKTAKVTPTSTVIKWTRIQKGSKDPPTNDDPTVAKEAVAKG